MKDSTPSTPRYTQPKVTVLLVGGAQDDLASMQEILASPDSEVLQVGTGQEALEQLALGGCAVVLIVAQKPRLEGFDIAQRIRADERFRSTPIIFLTDAEIGQSQIEAGFALGAVDFLTKPLSPVVVRAKVSGLASLFQETRRSKREAEQLRMLIQSTTDYAIFMLDPTGHIVTWNTGAERIKQYKADEIIGQHFSQFYPQEALDRGWPLYELKVAAAEGRFEDEGWRVRKDGSQFWANVVITAVKDGAGTLLGFTKVTRDLTVRKQAEETAHRLAEETAARRVAHEEREWLLVTLASIGDAVIATDNQGRVTFLNRVAEQLTGWTSKDAQGMPLDDVFPIKNEETGLTVENPVEKVLRDDVIVGLANHTVLIARDGTQRPIDDSAAPIRDLAGNLIGVVLIFRDVTEQRRAARELREQTNTAEALVRVSSLLAQEHDLQRLVQVVTDEGTRLCSAEFGAFFYNVTGEKGETYTLYTLSGVPREAFAQFPMPRNTAVFGPTFRGEGVVRLDDVTQDHRYGKSEPYYGMPSGHLPVRSYLAVPVFARNGEVLGGLFFGSTKVGAFTSQHEQLMVGIAGQAGVAIDNARLYSRTQAVAERLNIALAAADLGDWNWDASNDLVTFSPRAAEIFAIPPGPQMTWTQMQGLIHEDDRERVKQEVERVIAERDQYDIEYRVNRPDGRMVWVGVRGRAIYNESDEVTGMYGVVQDISERKSLEESLRASEARFRGLMEQAPFSIQVFSPDGRPLRVNRAWEELWGVTLEDIDGYNVLQDPQLEAKGVMPQIRQAFAGEASFVPAVEYDPNETVPEKTRHSDPVRWVGAVAYPLKDEAGVIQEVVVVHDDITARRKAEAALRESEELLRLMTDTIPQLAWMAKPDGHIFWYNRRWYEYTGTTPEQMEGWGWQAVHDSGVLPDVIERWKHSLATGELFSMVFPLRGADGVMRPFLTRVNPLRNDQGQLLYWFGTNTDISEMRQAQEALADSEQRLRLALEAGRMGVWDWNVRTGDLKWSDSLEPLHGLEPGTFGGTFEHFQQLIHPEDRGLVQAEIRQALETHEDFYVEFRNIRPNGGIHWIAGSGKVFYGEDGLPLRMIGIGLDVTQRKRTEQTSQFLADASAALAVLVDFESTLQKVSSLAIPAFADWATVDLVETDGKLRRVSVSHVDPAKVQLAHEVHRRFPPDPLATHGAWNIIRTGHSELVPEITDELLVRSADNDELLGILRALGLKSYIGVPLTVRGKTIGVITFINAESEHLYDHTDLAVAEDLASRAAIAIENAQLYRELREADRRKDEFLATLAHELRNPLAPIRNGLEVLRISGAGGGLVEEARQMMERQLAQMVRLVDDLLDVSRITRNRLQLRKERVSLVHVIDNAVETSRPLIEQAGHAFSLTLPSVPVYLDADLTRLAQVFSNLLNNAVKYTEPGGQIALRAEVTGPEVIVKIKDNGLGIPTEALPVIFEMFSQVDRNLERAQGGLGIGLTLVRRLVEMHGGSVNAYSEGPGRGSEFVVRLPIVEDTDDAVELGNNADFQHQGKRRILVVDDNRDSAITLAMMLKLMGNETFTAHDGIEAIEAANNYRPDIILLDIGLPKMNGYDVCRFIRSQPWSNGILIIALTGWGQEEDRRRSSEAGFDHHLVKPVEIEALEKLLSEPRQNSPWHSTD